MADPLGYAPRPTWVRRACALHASLMACSIVLAVSELVFNLPVVFSSRDLSAPTAARGAATVVGVALGAWIGHRTRAHAYSRLFEAAIALALFVQLTPWLYWFGFDGRWAYRPLLWCLPGISAFGLSLFACWWFDCATANLHRNGAFNALVNSDNVLMAACFAATTALSLSFIGPLLHGHFLALTLIVLGACAAAKRLAVCSSLLNRAQRAWYVGVALAALVASAAAALRVLPLRVIRESPHPIIHYETGAISDLKVTSAQGAFHVFNAGRLRFSTLDHTRWAQALTRPALSRLDCPERALVMSLGEGLIERELLSDPCILSIDSIVRDGTTLAAARREPWWRELTRDAWSSARVRTRVVDPARWVSTDPATPYDLLIVDLPDPDDYINVKYFTRYFYRQLARRMAPNGILVVQATSALRSPNTFASIQATLRAAGLVTVPYRVAMTTLGEWSFLLAQQDSIRPVRRPQWLKHSTLGAAETFALAPDSSPTIAGQISRLNEPAILDTFLHEGGDHAP